MTTATAHPRPHIEGLLEAAHEHYAQLREQHAALVRSGIAAECLPDDVGLMAFAALGEHDRASVVRELEGQWETLLHKGLARGALKQAGSPWLRLLVHALPHTAAVEDVWQRLTTAVDARNAGPFELRCASRVQGHWGQLARVHFHAAEAAHLTIVPDPIFGRQPALVAADANGHCAGHFAVPVDAGEVTLTVLRRDGEIVRHVVRFVVAEA
jgi:hypothetical protein